MKCVAKGIKSKGGTDSPAKRKKKVATSEFVSPNHHITDKLEKLLEEYENSGDEQRATQTIKTIQFLSEYKTEVTSFEEVQALHLIDEEIADRVQEVIISAHEEKQAVLVLLNKILKYDYTGTTSLQSSAESLYRLGYHSVVDLLLYDPKEIYLTRSVLIALKYWDDINESVSREEVEEILDKARAFVPGCDLVGVGLYRRGNPTCDDIIILITHPDGHSHKDVVPQLINGFGQDKFFVEVLDFLYYDSGKTPTNAKWICRLGEDRKFRLIEFVVGSYDMYPHLLFYYTGPKESMQSIVDRADSMGMVFHYGVLYTGGYKQYYPHCKAWSCVTDCNPAPVTSERELFDHLELEYLEPCERNEWYIDREPLI